MLSIRRWLRARMLPSPRVDREDGGCSTVTPFFLRMLRLWEDSSLASRASLAAPSSPSPCHSPPLSPRRSLDPLGWTATDSVLLRKLLERDGLPPLLWYASGVSQKASESSSSVLDLATGFGVSLMTRFNRVPSSAPGPKAPKLRDLGALWASPCS